MPISYPISNSITCLNRLFGAFCRTIFLPWVRAIEYRIAYRALHILNTMSYLRRPNKFFNGSPVIFFQLIKYIYFPVWDRWNCINFPAYFASFDVITYKLINKFSLFSFGYKVRQYILQNLSAIILRTYSPMVKHATTFCRFGCTYFSKFKPVANNIKKFFIGIGNYYYRLERKTITCSNLPHKYRTFTINNPCYISCLCSVHNIILS